MSCTLSFGTLNHIYLLIKCCMGHQCNNYFSFSRNSKTYIKVNNFSKNFANILMMLATVIMKVMMTTKDRMMSKNGQCRDCRNWVRPSRILQERVLQCWALFTAVLGNGHCSALYCSLCAVYCSGTHCSLQQYTLFSIYCSAI